MCCFKNQEEKFISDRHDGRLMDIEKAWRQPLSFEVDIKEIEPFSLTALRQDH